MAPRASSLLASAGAAAVLGWALLTPLGAHAQVLRAAADTSAVPVDSSDVRARARREQARFETRRVRLLPSTWWRGGGECEERIGRFCFWFGDGGRDPTPEPPSVVEARDALVAYLDSVQALLPADGWITGQRVWYRVEALRWHEALDAAASCRAEAWWCAALRGLALHGLGRYPQAAEAFQEALEGMDPERAARWRDPRMVLDGGARRALREAEAKDPDAMDRVWAWADPLLLVPGNDRRTEHYARWTVSALKDDARNPFGISWGRDLEELTVRMGWEVAWERTLDAGTGASVVGHHARDGRDFLPSEEGIGDPSAALEALQPDDRRPRTLYSPPMAPAVVPLHGQLAVFPRGDGMRVVATHFLPPDTAARPAVEEARGRLAAPGSDTLPRKAGLFLLPRDGGPPRGVEREGEDEGALVLSAPAGAYVVAVESWAPALRRAGRFRAGLVRDSVPPDVVTLSDLLLVEGSSGEPTLLEDVAPRALVRPEVVMGEPVSVAWEVNGLGWAPEEVAYELSVERTGVGLLRRLGQAVGLVDPVRPLSLSWTEPGPQRPGPVLRVVALELGAAEPGPYRVTLRARVPGRGLLTARAAFRVEAPEVDDEGRPF